LNLKKYPVRNDPLVVGKGVKGAKGTER